MMWNLRYELRRAREKVLISIVWKLPRAIVMWATIRLWAHATTGDYGSTVVHDLTIGEALKRWDSA